MECRRSSLNNWEKHLIQVRWPKMLKLSLNSHCTFISLKMGQHIGNLGIHHEYKKAEFWEELWMEDPALQTFINVRDSMSAAERKQTRVIAQAPTHTWVRVSTTTLTRLVYIAWWVGSVTAGTGCRKLKTLTDKGTGDRRKKSRRTSESEPSKGGCISL